MKRITISGTLLAETGLHIGGTDEDAAVDMIVSVDATGTPIIPGTALTGALRGVLDPGHAGTARWGDAEDIGASPIEVDDSVLQGADGAASRGELTLDIRDGVSISRFWGSAVSGMLYNREVLPAGSSFTFRARVATTEHDDGNEGATCACAACDITRALCAGIQVGAGATTGLGRVRLDDPLFAVLDMSRQGMETLLGGGPEPVAWAGGTGAGPARPRLELAWRPLGPIMSKVSLEGRAVDAIPRAVQRQQRDAVTGEVTGRVHLLLPGSSVKGSLRAQSEKIVNTIMGPDPGSGPPEDSALAQLELLEAAARSRYRPSGTEDPDHPWGPIGLLYGAATRGRKTAGGRRGAVLVDDIASTRPIPAEDWAALMVLALKDKDKDADTPALAAKAHHLGFKLTTRVAVDRWTGGAAEHLLYTSLDPYFTGEGDWSPITLTLDLPRLGDPEGDDARAALGLLWLTIEDLRRGRFGLGFGQTRGYGAVRVGTVTGSGLPGGAWPEEFPTDWINALQRVLTGTGGEES